MISSPFQFKNNVKDCKLPDPSDNYILKWLVGMLICSYYIFEKKTIAINNLDYLNSAKFRFELSRENAATRKLYTISFFIEFFELIS